jgi:hypothetical protein
MWKVAMRTLNITHAEKEQQANARPDQRILLVTSVSTESRMLSFVGRAAYSYRFVYRAFGSLLQRWAPIREVEDPEKEFPRVLGECEKENLQPFHLSFLPFHLMPRTPQVPTIAVPAWEFPTIPDRSLGGDPRHNWVARSQETDVIITHTQYSRNAFLRSGVTTPVIVVPVPLNPLYFQVPAWNPGQRVTIDCPCYTFPDAAFDSKRFAPLGSSEGKTSLRVRMRREVTQFKDELKTRLPVSLLRFAKASAAAMRAAREVYRQTDVPLPRPQAQVDLSGIVYTSILNHIDGRKNWYDLLTGYLSALQDQEDATLVVKLILSPNREQLGIKEVVSEYLKMGIPHRCKLIFIGSYMSEEQLAELARGSTYYVNTSCAEGSCLPLQDFLAAARPSVAPPHTGMGDSINQNNAFLIDSHLEPICYPQDPAGALSTRWYRLVWQSYYEQLQESYRVAHEELRQYHQMGENGRQAMAELSSAEKVWPVLKSALDLAQPTPLRRAG